MWVLWHVNKSVVNEMSQASSKGEVFCRHFEGRLSRFAQYASWLGYRALRDTPRGRAIALCAIRAPCNVDTCPHVMALKYWLALSDWLETHFPQTPYRFAASSNALSFGTHCEPYETP